MVEPPKRRRIRFSLRTFFLLLTVFAVWLGWKVTEVRQRHRMEDYVKSIGPPGFPVTYGESQKPWKSLPVVWRLMGVRPIQRIYLERSVPKEDREQITAWF